jgi:multiple sugar transport system permease protein
MRLSQFGSQLLLNLLVAVGGILTALPFFWMFTASFKTTRELFTYPPTLLPESFSLANYRTLFERWEFGQWYFNSLITALAVTVAVLFFSSLAGFGFAKYEFRGKRALFLVLLGSTMIPFQIIVIPLFIQISRWGWTNSLVGIVIPFIAPAFGIFLMRQYMAAIPSELIDAARVDGATDFFIYERIILPLVRPGLATLAIFTFLGSWNSLLWPLVVLRDEKVLTLPIGVANMLTGVTAGTEPPYGSVLAASTLMSLPLIIIFSLVQKHYISGLTIGAVKQ